MNLKLISILLFINYTECANILGISVFPSMSHQNVFRAIWKELSLKGHNVTVVTPDPLNDLTMTNLTEISVSHVYEMYKYKKLNNIMSKDKNIFESLYAAFHLLNAIVEIEINSTQFRKLLLEENKFDLILVECYYPVLYALAKKFQAPIIGVSSFAAMAAHNDLLGNSYHPILYPDLYITHHSKELSLWHKLKNVLFVAWSVFHHKYFVTPRNDNVARTIFGGDIPYVGDLEKNISLFYVNRNQFISYAVPSVPEMIDIGQIQIKSVKPLPKELQQILDNAREGAIYFSLGNSVKCADLELSFVKVITNALSELPYKIIWKWDLDYLPDKPPNVITRKWLPQQDLLAHPNIRAFVTQGGMQSTDEAIARAVPLVVMPFILDQPMHMQKVVDLGIGVGVDPSTVTKEELKKSIIEVSENRSYKKRIEKIRDLLFDKHTKSVQNAVWWSEYVIRHGDVKFIRSPSADISWFYYFMLDVCLTLVVALTVISYGSYKVVKLIFEARNCE